MVTREIKNNAPNLHEHCFQFLLGLSQEKTITMLKCKILGGQTEYCGIFRNGLLQNSLYYGILLFACKLALVASFLHVK